MDGVTFDTGAGPDAVVGAQPPATTPTEKAWEKVEAEIVLLNAYDHMIATVWHPHARGEVIATTAGNVRVAVGEKAQYQLSTGELVDL